MNYQETIDFLFNQFPAYQKDGSSAFKPGLERVIQLSALVENPHEKTKTIHVAGTNGKGSCSHMLASILQESGLKVGLFTSPHLKDFRERIKINGKEIDEDYVIEFVQNLRTQATEIAPSFFEYTTIMAFKYFADQAVDIAIIETGLGGRLDCSNIIQPELSIITNIGLDHQQFLGPDITAIAGEKAGIIKHNTPVVVGREQPETQKVFSKKAALEKAELTYSNDEALQIELDLKGNYQIENAKTVITATRKLIELGWRITNENIQVGLENVIQNTGFRGRWQQLETKPTIVCDTGHNEDGIQWIVKQLKLQQFEQLHIVWGMVNDKDSGKILKLLPKTAHYYWCAPQINRALSSDLLQTSALAFNLKGNCFNSVKEALEAAKSAAHPNDFIFIGGSTFVVAEVV